MSEVVVLVTLVARPGKESEAEKFLWDLLEPSHKDAGCLLYAVHRAVDDPRGFAFVERWESRELLEQHIATEHIQTAMSRVDEFFTEGPDIVVYDAIPGGVVDKGSIAGHAGGSRSSTG
jgi:quinol monooxygenase YgiN